MTTNRSPMTPLREEWIRHIEQQHAPEDGLPFVKRMVPNCVRCCEYQVLALADIAFSDIDLGEA